MVTKNFDEQIQRLGATDSSTGQPLELKADAVGGLQTSPLIVGQRNKGTANEYLATVTDWNESIVASTGGGSIIVGVTVPCIVKSIRVGGSAALAGDVSRRDGGTMKEPQCLKLGAATGTGPDLGGIRHNTDLTLVFAAAGDQVLVAWKPI